MAHASVWAFEVTGDVISAGEPGGHMSARKITDDGALLLAVNCKPWPAARLETCGRGRDLSRCTAMKWAHHPNLRKRPRTPAKGRGSVQRAIRRAFAASGTPIRRSDGLECRSPGPQPERPCGVPSELHALGIDLFLHQQGLDTTTPAGKAMFQMLGVFAEFERSIIQERVRAGLQRAKREGKRLGRPPIADKLAERIRAALAGGMSVRKTAAKFDVNPSTVQRVAHPFDGADNASVAGAAWANRWSGPAASIGWNASRQGGVSGAPWGEGARKSKIHPGLSTSRYPFPVP